jgi:hypothetical protein
MTTHNIHIRQTSIPPVGFELTISASEQPQTYALDRLSIEVATDYSEIHTKLTNTIYGQNINFFFKLN